MEDAIGALIEITSLANDTSNNKTPQLTWK
jgi:hypothetical protein